MSALESRIDDLYEGRLDEFVSARQILAKTLTGDEKKRVAALQKPLVIPWVVNQTYWHARRVYDALLAAGAHLRAAQVGALKGRSTDIRGASDRHAEALTKAVAEAVRLANEEGLHPAEDALRRMFEAVSSRELLPAPHGRFVQPLEPAGFEALAGIAIAPPPRDRSAGARGDESARHAAGGAEPEQARPNPAETRRREVEERRRERERGEAERRRKTAIQAAEKRAAQAVEAERRARAAWDEARREVEKADRALADLLEGES